MTDDREHISRQHSRAWTEREGEREREKKEREKKERERGRVWGPSRQLVVIPTTGALIAGNPPTQDSHHMPRNHSANNLIDKEQDGAGVSVCLFVFVRLSVCLSVRLCMVSLHDVRAWVRLGAKRITVQYKKLI